jgi:hypothetical protein
VTEGIEARTSSLLGDNKTKLSGLAMRNINDSTLNWEPRLMTEKKSTPKTQANSLADLRLISRGDEDPTLTQFS